MLRKKVVASRWDSVSFGGTVVGVVGDVDVGWPILALLIFDLRSVKQLIHLMVRYLAVHLYCWIDW